MRQPLSLPSGGTVVVVVDLQEEQRHDPRFPVEGFEPLLDNVARILAAARRAGVPVLHTAYVRDFARVPPRPFEPMGPNGTPYFSDPAAKLTAICAEVAPLAGEFLAHKNDASAFSSPEFDAEVARLAPEWMIVTGVWTEACIAATVRDAQVRGLRALVVKDACSSGTAHMHQSAMLHLANRLYGGGITDTETALGLIAGEAREVWQVVGTVPIRFTAESLSNDYSAL